MKKHAKLRFSSHSCSTRKIEHLRRKLLPLLIAGCLSHSSAWANPVDPQVVNGQVGFSKQGNLLSITNSPGAIINWQNFSINPGEITRFIQQNNSSSVLNRVVGQNPSQILGALQSNGRVFLINPNGILFGQGAQVDVNGLVASTLNLSNEDFLSGRLHFKAIDGAGNIQNQGAISTPSGGQVYLIAPNVENTGIINSPKGEVLLAAGHSVQLVDSAHPDLHVVVSAPENTTVNLGQIIAQAGTMGIYGALVKQRGIVSADSAVVGENGKIVFKSSKDTILDSNSQTTATGAGKGGDIHILGDRVGLAGRARVDASGQTGGGTVLIGGDYRGENPDIQNARRTYVDQSAVIKADAIQSGDGGKAIVWSDEITRVYGTLSARGGQQNGAGGFVETSGKQSLEYHAKVDVSAPAGKGGTLLLDPKKITLVGGTGDSASSPDGNTTFQGSSTPGTVNFADNDITSTGVSKIYQSELEGLPTGTHIVLEATDTISTTGSFSNRVTLPFNSNLTLRTRNASTDSSGLIGINLISSGDASSLEFKAQGTGSITLQTGTGTSPQTANIDVGKLTTEGGQVAVNATGNIVLHGVTTTPMYYGSGGNVSISSSGGSLLLSGGDIDTRGMYYSGSVSLTSAGNISMQNTKTIYADQLKMTAVTGIHGSSNTDGMNTQVNVLHALNTGLGPIQIHNSVTHLSINDISSVGYGIKQVKSGQGINIANASGLGISIHSQISTNGGNVDISAPSGMMLTPYSPIMTNGGDVNLSAKDTDATVSLPFNSLIKSGGGTVTLQADKMSLMGKIDVGSGIVKLLPLASKAIYIGTTHTDTMKNTLELSSAELNTVTASVLRIGDASSGAIDIQSALDATPGGALEHISSALSLTSGGAITQQAGATIGLIPAVAARGGSVTLTEANPTGVISGESTNGDFQYRSSNQLAIDTVDGISGIKVPSTANIRLISDSAQGILQTPGNVIDTHGGGLMLKTIGPVFLLNGGNTIGKLAADLNPGNAGTGTFFLYNSADLDIAGPLFGVSGITTHNQNVMLATDFGKTLTISQPIHAGTAQGLLQADTLILNNTVTAAHVGIHPSTTGRKITVGSAVCASDPCLNVTHLYQIAAPTIGIGTNDHMSASGDIYVAGITDSNSNAATDIKHGVTTRIGLLTGSGDITQGGTITIQDLGVSAEGSVNLNLSNSITNFVGEAKGNINLVNATGLNIISISDSSSTASTSNVPPPTHTSVGSTSNITTSSSNAPSLSGGIFTDSGNVSLTANTGDISLMAPIYAGAGSVTLNAQAGAISQSGGSIIGTSLNVAASHGIGHDNPLMTQVDSLTATHSGANTAINIMNMGALVLQNIVQSTPGSSGSIGINAVGDLTVASGQTVATHAGNIHLKAAGALTVDGAIHSLGGGDIILEAGVGTTPSGTSTQSSLSTPFSYSTYGANRLATNSSSSISSISDLTLNASIYADTGDITLNAAGGAIVQNAGSITGSSLTALASNGIGHTAPLMTQVASLAAMSSGTATDINISNTGALALQDIAQSASGGSGSISVLSNGILTVASGKTISTEAGNINLESGSTFTVEGSILSVSGGAITLAAGIAGSTDTLTINGSINTAAAPGVAVATTGNMLLKAGSAIIINGSVNGNVTQQANINSPAPPPPPAPPTLNQCMTTPSLSGCSSVLPTLSQCTTSPTLAGCSVVLPTLSQCTATPTLAGCSVVLPSITQNSEPESLVTQAMNSTVNAVNSTNDTVAQPISTHSPLLVSTETSTEATTETSSSSPEEKSDQKDKASDDKKDADKNTTGTKDSGAKKNDVAKKMYCN